MQKEELRRRALQQRNALNLAERRKRDARIKNQLETLPLFKKSLNILLYFSVKSEAGTEDIMRNWFRKKSLYLPGLNATESFTPLRLDSLETLELNHFGIPEPPKAKGRFLAEPELDLIIVPGVAFDIQGNRIGMGKGYYDRFLATHRGIPRIGLAYSEQVLDRIPHKPYDEPVDIIITEKEIIRCQS